jgi:hypothetical protein
MKLPINSWEQLAVSYDPPALLVTWEGEEHVIEFNDLRALADFAMGVGALFDSEVQRYRRDNATLDELVQALSV